MEIAKYISVLLASMIKFFGGPIAGFFSGIPFRETVILSATGMMVAVICTTIFATTIKNYLENRPNTKKRIFTKSNRFAVKIWNKLGLFGIALLTPVLFTPIGGTLLALSFKVNIYKMFGYMLVSAIFWGIIVTWLMFKLTFISNLFQ